MLLYNSIGPNPRVVRMFMAERGIELPSVEVDLQHLTWLDGLMAGKRFIAGDHLMLADILLFAFVDFLDGRRQPINQENKNIVASHARMKARPSATA